jgi:hypothetical protein
VPLFSLVAGRGLFIAMLAVVTAVAGRGALLRLRLWLRARTWVRTLLWCVAVLEMGIEWRWIGRWEGVMGVLVL